MKAVLVGLLVTFAVPGFTIQDPLKTLPDSYSRQFENDWVRVVRVRYAPFAKLPAHAHNALPAAYVYLNDGGPVLFKHIGTSYGAATRPATKAGGFRLYRGIDEIHEVENTSELPSEFLRVEFKTEPKEVATLKGRFYREPVGPGENADDVQFENGQIRVTRIVRGPGHPVRIAASASEPALLIALRNGRLRESTGTERAVRIGQELWVAASGSYAVHNLGGEAVEFLRFDFKTGPTGSRSAFSRSDGRRQPSR